MVSFWELYYVCIV